MHVNTAIHLVGMTGVFPSRAFIPAFAVALAMRFGQGSEYLQSLGLTGPTWFTHNITLVILGILSVLELAATKSPEIREFLDDFDGYLKSGMTFIVTTGVLSATDVELLQRTRQAGFGWWAFAALLAAGVFFLATLRGATLRMLAAVDEDDDLGIQGLISWMEDLWTLFGVLLLVLYPIVMLVLAGLFFLTIYLVRKYFQHREEQSKVPCPSCNEPVYPTALQCASCKAELKETRGVGLFGRSLSVPAGDREKHQLGLVEYKRCPVCASHLTERAPKQKCSACGHELMGDKAFAERYQVYIGERLPRVLGISFALGFIPVVGAIPAIVYSRLALVAPFRRYVPMGIGCAVKWLVRLLNLVLILLQIVPFLGAFMMPLMAWVNYLAYRQVYRSTLGV